jgi:hypothetical protein
MKLQTGTARRSTGSCARFLRAARVAREHAALALSNLSLRVKNAVPVLGGSDHMGMAQERRKGGRFGDGTDCDARGASASRPRADAVRIRGLSIAEPSERPQIPSALPLFRPSVKNQVRGFLSAGADVRAHVAPRARRSTGVVCAFRRRRRRRAAL